MFKSCWNLQTNCHFLSTTEKQKNKQFDCAQTLAPIGGKINENISEFKFNQCAKFLEMRKKCILQIVCPGKQIPLKSKTNFYLAVWSNEIPWTSVKLTHRIQSWPNPSDHIIVIQLPAFICKTHRHLTQRKFFAKKWEGTENLKIPCFTVPVHFISGSSVASCLWYQAWSSWSSNSAVFRCSWDGPSMNCVSKAWNCFSESHFVSSLAWGVPPCLVRQLTLRLFASDPD